MCVRDYTCTALHYQAHNIPEKRWSANVNNVSTTWGVVAIRRERISLASGSKPMKPSFQHLKNSFSIFLLEVVTGPSIRLAIVQTFS